jgi:Nif-specific regulatory protein
LQFCYYFIFANMHSPSQKLDIIGLIADVNAILAGSRDTATAIRTALETIRPALGFASIFLLLREADGESLSLACAAGLNVSEFRKLDARADRSVLRDVFSTATVLQISDLSSEPSLENIFEFAELSGMTAVPVMIGDSRLGVLAACSSDHLDLKLLELLASMIAQTYRIEHAVRGERQKLREENTLLKHELKEKYDFTHIVGNSNAIKQVYEQVTQVARSNATVLLRGESGTGKEMIANAIHYNSLRSKKPLVKVNCAALPETLIESELFGHEKGAFTGADRFRKGRFEMAEGGTLFLDEIGDLPPQTQIKLLRVLQEREFERVGGTETIKANIRLVAATNKNLEQAIIDGRFREDLYYRLNVFSIFLPPLRERKSDILLLAEHFLERYEAEHAKRIRRISTPAIDMLMSYHFPGNVRELENAIERAVLVCDSNVIHGHHLPPTLQTAEVTGTITDLSLESAVAAFERDMIQDALKSTKGNIAKAARSLGSTERVVGYKIRKYGIDTIRFRR